VNFQRGPSKTLLEYNLANMQISPTKVKSHLQLCSEMRLTFLWPSSTLQRGGLERWVKVLSSEMDPAEIRLIWIGCH
jgi:hypothetical protein